MSKYSSLFLSLPVGDQDEEVLTLLKTLNYPKPDFHAQNTLAYFQH